MRNSIFLRFLFKNLLDVVFATRIVGLAAPHRTRIETGGNIKHLVLVIS